jgi:hypothetical protein
MPGRQAAATTIDPRTSSRTAPVVECHPVSSASTVNTACTDFFAGETPSLLHTLYTVVPDHVMIPTRYFVSRFWTQVPLFFFCLLGGAQAEKWVG